MPSNWDKGFSSGELRIGGNGSERPFLHNGTWKIRVFDVGTQEHAIYDYSTDLAEQQIEKNTSQLMAAFDQIVPKTINPTRT